MQLLKQIIAATVALYIALICASLTMPLLDALLGHAS
jgi:hypothetical protein